MPVHLHRFVSIRKVPMNVYVHDMIQITVVLKSQVRMPMKVFGIKFTRKIGHRGKFPTPQPVNHHVHHHHLRTIVVQPSTHRKGSNAGRTFIVQPIHVRRRRLVLVPQQKARNSQPQIVLLMLFVFVPSHPWTYRTIHVTVPRDSWVMVRCAGLVSIPNQNQKLCLMVSHRRKQPSKITFTVAVTNRSLMHVVDFHPVKVMLCVVR